MAVGAAGGAVLVGVLVTIEQEVVEEEEVVVDMARQPDTVGCNKTGPFGWLNI